MRLSGYQVLVLAAWIPSGEALYSRHKCIMMGIGWGSTTSRSPSGFDCGCWQDLNLEQQNKQYTLLPLPSVLGEAPWMNRVGGACLSPIHYPLRLYSFSLFTICVLKTSPYSPSYQLGTEAETTPWDCAADQLYSRLVGAVTPSYKLL